MIVWAEPCTNYTGSYMYSQSLMQVAFTSIESEQQFALHVGSSVVKVTLFNIGYFSITDAPS